MKSKVYGEANPFPSQSVINSFQLDNVVPKSAIYFAVKTCQKYHHDRVPVVKNTWAKHAEYLHFFSDVQGAFCTLFLRAPI